MQIFKKIVIDLFDEGAGAASTGTGSNDSGNNTDSAKPESVRSEIVKKGKSLGLTDDLMESYQKAYDSKHTNTDTETDKINKQKNTEEQQIKASESDSSNDDEEFEKLIKGKYKDSYNKRFRNALSDRMHSRDTEISDLKAKTESADKILKMIALKYPQIDGQDYNALLKAVENDNDTWQQKALDGGVTADEAKRQYIDGEKQAQTQAELETLKREKAAGELDARLNNLAKETQKMYPDFDLHEEFENPKFCAALDFIAQQNEAKNKNSGKNEEIFDLTYAYEMAHADEIRNKTVNKASKAAISAVTQSIAANGSRPIENANSHSTPTEPKSVSDMSDREFDVLLDKIKHGAARIPR